MDTSRRHAVAALTAAGMLWGCTVPLSKLALLWLAPGWLTAVRFGLAAAVLLPVARHRGLRVRPAPLVQLRMLAAGAVGYGVTIVVQNAGVARTSVTHAALLIGALPVLVAVIAAAWHRAAARPRAWLGFAISLGGVGLVTAGGSGGGASLRGDGLVLVSLLLCAGFTVAQGRLLPGRDPVAVTAVQFLGAALAGLPVAMLSEGTPASPWGSIGPGPVLATAALVVAGTLAPFTLFAYGQSRVPAQVAGAFLNLEPLVGAIAGVVFFGDPAGLRQLAGGLAVVAGIALSAWPAASSKPGSGRTAAGAAARPGRSVVEVGVEHGDFGDLVDRQAVDLRGLPDGLRRGPVVDAERGRLVLAHVGVQPGDAEARIAVSDGQAGGGSGRGGGNIQTVGEGPLNQVPRHEARSVRS